MAAFSEEIVLSGPDSGRRFRAIDFRDVNLVVRDDGFFNATKLCESANKKLGNFQQIRTYETLLNELATLLKCGDCLRYSGTGVANQIKDGDTFYHPLLFLGLASWCGVECYVKSAVVMHMFFAGSDERRDQIKKLCAFKDKNAEEEISNAEKKIGDALYSVRKNPSSVNSDSERVKYAGTDLIIDTRGMFFNATQLCGANNKLLNNFIQSKRCPTSECEDVLSQYFNSVTKTIKDAQNATCTYFHPILFVQLAAWICLNSYGIWIRADVYVKAARVVLAYGTNNADVREERAGTASSSDNLRNRVKIIDIKLEKRISDLALQYERTPSPSPSDLMKRKTGDDSDDGGDVCEEMLTTTTATVDMDPAPQKEHRIESSLARGVQSVLVFRLPVEKNPPVYRLYSMRRQMLGLASAIWKNFRGTESVVAVWYITDDAELDYKKCQEEFHRQYPGQIETPSDLIISQSVPIGEMEQCFERQLENLRASKADAMFCNDLLHAADDRRRDALKVAERRVQEEQDDIIRVVYRSLLNDFRKIYALL